MDDNEVYTTAQVREYQDGRQERDPHPHEHAGLVRDEKVARVLSIISESYDPRRVEDPSVMPGDPERLAAVQEILRVESDETLRRALDAGDMPTLKHLTGDAEERHDLTSMRSVEQLDSLVGGPAPVVCVIGEMGAGKTDAAGLLGERYEKQVEGDLLVASNIETLKESTAWTEKDGTQHPDGWISDYGTLVEWLEQDGDPVRNDQQPKLFIFDEASSVASGRGKQGYETAVKMAPLMYRIRKYRAALIYVAHGPKSIHPMMWRVGKIVKKTGLKTAQVASSIKNNSLGPVEFELSGIPPTNWRFHTQDEAPWTWEDRRSSEDDDEDESVGQDELVRASSIWTVVQCKDDGMTDREAAKYVPYSKTWVNNIWREYNEDGEHRDKVDRVEAIIK